MPEAESNTETVVITDLNLGGLAMQRELGSVTHLRDRRPDLFDLTSKLPIDIVRISR